MRRASLHRVATSAILSVCVDPTIRGESRLHANGVRVDGTRGGDSLKLQPDSRSRPAATEFGIPPSGGRTAAAAGESAPAGSEFDEVGCVNVAETLEPMLAALVRLAGAAAATVRVVSRDGARFEPVGAVGLPAGLGPRGIGAVEFWCGACAEARQPESECVKRHLCGCEQRFPVDRLGSVCKHIVAVPLQHKARPVGMLNLLFERPADLPPALTPLFAAIGDLLGVTLENDRLARENLRVSLMNERQMMANEVHDSLAQGLTYMRMRMSLMRDAIRQGDELRAFKYWSDVDESLGNAHRRLRELITYFRSRMDPNGLLHALRETTDSFHDRTGIRLEFANRAPDLCLAAEREVEAFHIVQEALANVCRHAHAHTARLIVERRDGGYEIVVEDDGVGIKAYAATGEQDDSGHYGIAIMRERARRLGGELVVEGASGGGTRVRLNFPAALPRSEHNV
jgi:two-component system nitrate/nitrite sensor histidine kinase NarX